jgi:DNA-binding CsgD family transcriptional regulator
VDIAASRGDDVMAARLQGMLRIALPLLERNVPDDWLTHHDSALRRVESTLGSRPMEAEIETGARVPWNDAINEAHAYVQSVLAAALPSTAWPPDSTLSALTERQMDVAWLLGRGLTNKEIAVRLDLTPKTVMHHTSDIYRRLGVRGRSEVMALIIRSGSFD